MTRKSEVSGRAERALELMEKGVPTWAICERLGIGRIKALNSLIGKARARRKLTALNIVDGRAELIV